MLENNMKLVALLQELQGPVERTPILELEGTPLLVGTGFSASGSGQKVFVCQLPARSWNGN